MDVVSELGELMADRGRQRYGELVTIAEHCLLTAAAAEKRAEPDSLVAACLLHDVGHFLDEPGKRSGADVPDLSHFRSLLEDLHARNVQL